jgi:hypothetical protein
MGDLEKYEKVKEAVDLADLERAGTTCLQLDGRGARSGVNGGEY